MDLLNTVGAKSDLGGEEVNALLLEERRVDKGRLDDVLLTVNGSENRVSESGSSLSHGEGGGTGTVLGLDNLVTAELDSVDELVSGLTGDLGVVGLRHEGNDGDTGVAANNGEVLLGGVGLLELRDESLGSDDVEGGDTEELLGVVSGLGLENLGNNGDGRVDGVGNHTDKGAGGVLTDGLGKVSHNGGVGVEEIVSGHAGLSGDTGGDEDELGTLEGISNAVVLGKVALDGGVGGDVRNISSNTRGSSEIVESEVSDVLVELEQQGQRLANATVGSKDNDLVLSGSGGGEGSDSAGGSSSEHFVVMGRKKRRCERGNLPNGKPENSIGARVNGAMGVAESISRGGFVQRATTERVSCNCARLCCFRLFLLQEPQNSPS